MEHVTFDEFFDFVKNEDADWYIPGIKKWLMKKKKANLKTVLMK